MQISETVIHKKTRKRCAVHVHISHLVRNLEASKGQVGKDHEQCHQTRVHEGSKCGVLMEARNLNWMRSGNNSTTGTVHSATKNGIIQHSHYHDISQAPPQPGVLYGPLHKQVSYG